MVFSFLGREYFCLVVSATSADDCLPVQAKSKIPKFGYIIIVSHYKMVYNLCYVLLNHMASLKYPREVRVISVCCSEAYVHLLNPCIFYFNNNYYLVYKDSCPVDD